MDSLHFTMNQHVKGKHLSFEERVVIQTRLKDGCSIRAIARELSCSPSTLAMRLNVVLFLSIMTSSSVIRLIMVRMFIRLIVATVVVNQTS